MAAFRIVVVIEERKRSRAETRKLNLFAARLFFRGPHRLANPSVPEANNLPHHLFCAPAGPPSFPLGIYKVLRSQHHHQTTVFSQFPIPSLCIPLRLASQNQRLYGLYPILPFKMGKAPKRAAPCPRPTPRSCNMLTCCSRLQRYCEYVAPVELAASTALTLRSSSSVRYPLLQYVRQRPQAPPHSLRTTRPPMS